MMANTENNSIYLNFSAISDKLSDKIPDVKEIKTNTYNKLGISDDYFKFIYNLYQECPTFQTVINGFSDYIVGNGVSSSVLQKPNPSESWDEFVLHIAADYLLYDVAYIQIIRKLNGAIDSLYWLDAQYVRTDEDNQTFWYNKKFGSNYVKSSDTIMYPKFKKDFNQPSSVLMLKTALAKGTYGSPIWVSATKSIITEIQIDQFHMSELENNFAGSCIINFNNGIPSEEDRAEIQKMVTKKFTGAKNAGSFLLSFNAGKTNATTVERLTTDDFANRYNSLATKTQKQILTAFGAPAQLFGIEKESTGFNTQDYMEAYKIFQRTKVYPIQKRIIDQIDKIFSIESSITIKPFSIDFDENESNNTEVVE